MTQKGGDTLRTYIDTLNSKGLIEALEALDMMDLDDEITEEVATDSVVIDENLDQGSLDQLLTITADRSKKNNVNPYNESIMSAMNNYNSTGSGDMTLNESALDYLDESRNESIEYADDVSIDDFGFFGI
jgi:hypothetical protein